MINSSERSWLTVDDAYLKCLEEGLSRTKKTIRQWCRQDHVECQKRTTPNGEAWMIDASSLQVKISSELEFIRSQSNRAAPVQAGAPRSEPVQTGADMFEPVRTPRNPVEQDTKEPETDELARLERSVRSLEIDKGVRDAQIKFLEDENAKGRDVLTAQSRYIGHLETIAQLNGASPDAKFLASPVPKYESGTDASPVDFGDAERQNSSYNFNHGNTR